MEVDGEVFDVRDNNQGGTDYGWVSGPKRGYGFSSFPSVPFRPDADDHIAAIRDFLSKINPDTGYIGD